MTDQPRQGEPTPSTSPWHQEFGDNFDRVISIDVVFDEGTRAITGVTAHRDVDCQWTHISLGLGPDGTVESSPNTWTIPEGDNAIPLAEFTDRGLNTIEDVEALQITAW